MKNKHFARLALAASMSLALTSCTTVTPSEFARNPKAISQASLCRTFLQATDRVFQHQIAAELNRRSIQTYDCPAMVQQQDQAAAAIVAVALIGTAVAVCANNNCGAPSYPSYPSYRGNCQYSWQTDARGRRCGDRAADRRAGGW